MVSINGQTEPLEYSRKVCLHNIISQSRILSYVNSNYRLCNCSPSYILLRYRLQRFFFSSKLSIALLCLVSGHVKSVYLLSKVTSIDNNHTTFLLRLLLSRMATLPPQSVTMKMANRPLVSGVYFYCVRRTVNTWKLILQ